MRRVERQMLSIVIFLAVIMMLGFLTGYKLLPNSRVTVLYGAGEQLLESALPFQASLEELPGAESYSAPIEELLLHNAGLPTVAGLDWPGEETEPVLGLQVEVGVEEGFVEGAEDYSEKQDPRLIMIEEGALAIQSQARQLAADQPYIAIYCTHSSEEYSDGARISGQRGGVHTVAERLADQLNQLGLPTLYVDTIHDAPDWNLSYVNSLNTMEWLKAEYPSLEVFIDIHRDSESDSILPTASGNVARVMFIVGSNQRLEHPNWQQNLAFTQQLENAMEGLQSGISRGIRTYPGRYNQHITNKSILIEMGSTVNSTAEALATANLLAQALKNVLMP